MGPTIDETAGDALVPTVPFFRFLASQRDWVPQKETAEGPQAAAAAAAAVAAKEAAEEMALERTGRMRVEGSLVEVKVRFSRRRGLRFLF